MNNLDVLDEDFSDANAASEADGTGYNEFKAHNADTGLRRYKRGLIQGAGLTGAVVLVGGAFFLSSATGADWTSAENDSSAFGTGGFEIEISTDNGESWQDGTNLEDSASLTLQDLPADFEFEAGDTAGTTFLIRAAEETTHAGVIDPAEIEGAFSADSEVDGLFSYTIIDSDEQFRAEGEISESTDTAFSGDGSVVIPADREPVRFLLVVEASEDLPVSDEQYELNAAWDFVAHVAEGTEHAENVAGG